MNPTTELKFSSVVCSIISPRQLVRLTLKVTDKTSLSASNRFIQTKILSLEERNDWENIEVKKLHALRIFFVITLAEKFLQKLQISTRNKNL